MLVPRSAAWPLLSDNRVWARLLRPNASIPKRIVVDSRLRGEHRLEVIIHELRHAADWGRDEGFVDQESKDLARVLWRLGYRRADDG